ncbi:hypothetical protein A2673_03250 [Candidatus Kaiserbacteria bacterium RIFCSPHIGHO2_01_FULL_50_13]|uniref:Lycopene cyclase domain-containing protein n=1 Tax=Candidatus Kaiserbacteria bacterium RIFCSPLOWO2_01_FULL_50_24 TaxID=1798507 RepID=A0A1F6EIP2_9BACT|nr:MAG: hypothetical protein A2673_03250 [Candidatus Kaiserbacteria bacterium RIFCSPHIGHO2_01_FULL_50_13]OGG73521.1 MAG: hypothetical protein A3A34_01090 [Candidatus Kaiserbacteria bacterium RIFCSPLOWO2_01_FULL_50_24]OGG81570.1 MAG: hypothetical protein A3H74_00625 [Candidatus Kaiserbacteria bacterium RIFCSPLOWO2_02_FULL_51_13]
MVVGGNQKGDYNKAMRLLLFGSLLTAASWWLAWSQTSALSLYYFPPLWIGFILIVNGLSEFLFGDSLIRRMGWRFAILFIVSIPLWWFFEWLNMIVLNWFYIIPLTWTPTTILVMKTISFATVIPAVCSVAFLLATLFRRKKWFAFMPHVAPLQMAGSLALLATAGIYLMTLFPHELFPLVWLAPLFILDALNYRLGIPSIYGACADGNWRLVAAFSLGTLLTGFFWEMWNFYAMPKWIYEIPHVEFWHVFEMPILGYLGYLPFGLFVFSFTTLALTFVGRKLPLS